MEYKENKASNNYKKLPAITFVENSKDTLFIPLLMLFDANASGKTNLIDAIQVFQKVIKGGVTSKIIKFLGSIEVSSFVYFHNNPMTGAVVMKNIVSIFPT